jgi:hypothetical protein
VSDFATREDIEEIVGEVRRGFAGIHTRQDITNGRVGKLEVDFGRQDERIKSIGHEVFNRRADDRRARKADGETKPVTRREVVLVSTTIALVIAAMKFLAWLVPALPALGP